MLREEIFAAVKKKAMGYVSEEIVEEYVAADGEQQLTKRKVSYKDNPPDVTALKLLLELSPPEQPLTAEQIKSEKMRLLKLLSESENASKKSKQNR